MSNVGMSGHRHNQSSFFLGDQLTGDAVNSAYYSKFNFGFDPPIILDEELNPNLTSEIEKLRALMDPSLMTAAFYGDMNAMYPSADEW